MLKIIYSETGFHLEVLAVDRNDWIAERIQLTTSIGERLTVSKTRATFSLPHPIWEVEARLQMAGTNNVTVHHCDRDYVEVGLVGDWIGPHTDSDEGIFIARLPDRVEFCLWELWQVAKEELVAWE
jgi:hypothetical protein